MPSSFCPLEEGGEDDDRGDEEKEAYRGRSSRRASSSSGKVSRPSAPPATTVSTAPVQSLMVTASLSRGGHRSRSRRGGGLGAAKPRVPPHRRSSPRTGKRRMWGTPPSPGYRGHCPLGGVGGLVGS